MEQKENGKEKENEKGKEQRLYWLDGLKGLACLGVFAHHFMLAFFPASYYGAETQSFLGGVDTALSCEPFGVLFNGNFWVNLFLLIAAFLPACRIMQCREEELKSCAGTMILRRYPRLMLPILAAAAIQFVLVHILDRFGLNYVPIPLQHGFWDYVKHCVFLLYFCVDTTVIGPLWTIYYLFFAALFAILLAIPDRKENKWMPLVYLFLLYPVSRVDTNFTAFLFGVLLADIKCFRRLQPLAQRLKPGKGGAVALAVLLCLAGLFLGGYPSYVKPQNLYRIFEPFITQLPYQGILSQDIHAAGAFLLTSGILLWNSFGLPSFLSAKVPRYLGRISMGIFLLHSLWISYLGYYLRDRFVEMTGTHATAALLHFPLLLALLLVSSELFYRLVEKPAGKLCARIRV